LLPFIFDTCLRTLFESGKKYKFELNSNTCAQVFESEIERLRFRHMCVAKANDIIINSNEVQIVQVGKRKNATFKY